jgi:hypothetical protein
MAGVNRAFTESRHLSKGTASGANPCIFLSHISVDKASATAVGNYITSRGDIDIYLDVNDVDLQDAVSKGNPAGITRFIERGLSKSSHIMCLVSASTVSSWWVPYELGFAKNAGKQLSTLKLKGEVPLPAFLEIGDVIRGTKSLNDYLTRVRRGLEKTATVVTLSESLIQHSAQQHPLDSHLDWNA